MTEREFLTIASAIKAAWPNSNVMSDKRSMDVWYTMLADIDYRICTNAIKEIISTNSFPPSVAEIRKSCALENDNLLEWGEAWENVMRAIRFYGMYREKEALESLDDMTRKAVKRLGFKEICLSENIVADRANFRIIYEQLYERRKKELQIPLSVRTERQIMLDQIIQNTAKRIEGN